MIKTIIITLVILCLIVALGYYQKRQHNKTLQLLNESRPKLTRSEYINLLVEKGFDKHHVEVVYDNIRKLIDREDFSIYPEDDIHNAYGIDDLEDDEFISNICKALHIRTANQEDCNLLNKEMKTFNAEYILTITKNIAKDKHLSS